MSRYKSYPAYRETGLQWLEQIPSHWQIVQSRRLFSQRKDKATDNDQQLTASQKHGVLYQADFMALEGSRVVQVIKGADILKHVEPNDFVISMRSFQGGIEWSGLRGSISSAYVMLIPSSGVYAQYFRYLLKCDSYIQALQSTSDLIRDGQALRFDNFSQIDLPVVPYDEQQAIATHIERETIRIDGLVSRKTRFIELLREKRQALITHAVTKGLDPNVKMKDSGVEWLGDVPVHWNVKRLRYAASLNPAIKAGVMPDAEVSFLPMEAIGTDGSINLEKTRVVAEVRNGYSYFEDGDVTFAKVTPCFENGKGAVMRNLVGGIGFGTTELTVIRPNLDACVGFVNYLLQSDRFRLLGEGAMTGAGGLKRVPDEFTRNFESSWPALDEQQAITAYLDRKTTRIDTLISKTECSIELLKERRSALITAAVTGQIDLREAA
ncbi:MAG: hypothetical protein WC742_02855 [Gallionellaceae bacterium]|jgi:type I restriction enzyme S subunit